jgi:hypothetical protein
VGSCECVRVGSVCVLVGGWGGRRKRWRRGVLAGCCPAAGLTASPQNPRLPLPGPAAPPAAGVAPGYAYFSPFLPCSVSLSTHTRTPASPLAAGLDPYDPSTALDAATEIVSFTGSFHGRTMGSLALTYKARGPIVLGKAGRVLWFVGGHVGCDGGRLSRPLCNTAEDPTGGGCAACGRGPGMSGGGGRGEGVPLSHHPAIREAAHLWCAASAAPAALQDQYKTPFQPVMSGSVMVPYMWVPAAGAAARRTPARAATAGCCLAAVPPRFGHWGRHGSVRVSRPSMRPSGVLPSAVPAICPAVLLPCTAGILRRRGRPSRRARLRRCLWSQSKGRAASTPVGLGGAAAATPLRGRQSDSARCAHAG